MNANTIQKFNTLLQKVTKGKLSTFNEIVEMLVSLIKLKVNTNQNELIQRVTQSVTFTSIDEIQNFLSGYFDFSNRLIQELERLENIENDNIFDKEIHSLTKNILHTIPSQKLQESVTEFILTIVEVVTSEYPLKIMDNHDETMKNLIQVFGNEDVAFMFLTLNSIVPALQTKERLSFERVVTLTTPAFVFCMVMNSMRKEAFLKTQNRENNSLKPANSPHYKVGRNDACPCGSGRKYKQCCMNKDKRMPLDTIKFEEPKDVLPPFTRDEVHEFYTIWSKFINFVSKVYSEVGEQKYIKIYDKNKEGEFHFTQGALEDSYYINIRNFLAEYFYKLVEHFMDDNRVSKKNIAILYELRESYKNTHFYSFEMFENGNAIFYNPQNHTCFYVHKLLFDYSKVYPKAQLIETMFFNYKGRIVSDGIASSPKVEMGENMQNMLKEEYEIDRKNLLYSLELNQTPSKNIYQLKISIKGAKPPIWRRVLVGSEISFLELHDVIQSVFNWENYHMYQFFGKVGNYMDKEFVEEENFFGGKKDYPADKISMDSELQKIKDKIKYIYDFGDDWEHDIVLENILPYDEKKIYPVCVAGKRNGPVEDSGGIYSFNEIVEAIENPTFDNQNVLGEDGENYYKGYDPKEFDMKSVNEILQIK